MAGTTDRECFDKAQANGEPTFTLRAKDILAPQIVEEWANLLELHSGSPKKAEEARMIAVQMREWQAEHGRKVPD